MGLEITPRTVPTAYRSSELSRSAARAAVAAGELTVVRRGALVPPPTATTVWARDEERALAMIASAARRLSGQAVFSHASAALLHGLWLWSVPDVPEVTQRHRPNSHGARTLRRHHTELAADDVTTVSDLRVTTIERTIVDCARRMHPRDALVVADSGMRALIGANRFRRTDQADAVERLRERLLALVGTGPGHGRRRARAVIEAADPYSESPMETALRWIAVSRGLPRPTTQLPVRTRGGTFYADLGWRWSVTHPDGTTTFITVLLEYDGELKYLPGSGLVTSVEESSATVVAEKRREDLIREGSGTTVLRFSRDDLHDPAATFRRMLAAVPQSVRRNLQPVAELLAGPTRTRR